MNLRIAPQINKVFPGFMLGAIVVKNINNERTLSATRQLLNGVIAQKKSVISKSGIELSPSIATWRRYLESFGVNVQKHPPLLERIFKAYGKSEIVFYTALEDLLNYFSIKYELPVWGIDIDELCGDLELTHATGNEPFVLRGSAKMVPPQNGEVIYRDRAGVISRMWNTYESERTALMPFSKNICIFVENAGILDLEKVKNISHDVASLITKYCKGAAEMHVLGDTIFEINLGVSGRTGITDTHYAPEPKRIALQQKFLRGPIKPPVKLWVIQHGKKTEKKPQKPAPQESLPKQPPAEPSPEPLMEPELQLEAPKKETKPEPKPKPKPKPPAEQQQELTPKPTLEPKPEPKPVPAKKNKQTREPETRLIKEKLHDLLEAAIAKTFSEIKEIPEFSIEFPKESYFGDYSSNAAMILTKIVKSGPREIYDQLTKHLEKPQYISQISFAEPGFINFTLDKSWIQNELRNIIAEVAPYAKMNIGHNENIIVDFSSPNIAKPLGVHHLLSTVIGQALINIYKFIGYNALGLNYLGDWGTQFGKLITAYKLWGDKKTVAEDPMNEMLRLYVKFHEEAEKDKTLEDRAREEFKKLEDNDKENREIWEWLKELSLKDIQKTYDALGGVYFDILAPESLYNNKMIDVLDEGKKKEIFVAGEMGALIVDFKDAALPPFLVQKSDGATLYSTRDLASIKHRLSEWHPAKLIYVVDKAQSLYFKQLFKTVELLGWDKTERIHVDFGRMDFKDEKMSTRKGNIILLDEVLKEAIEKARLIVEQKNPKLKDKEKLIIASIVGIGAVKYNILSQSRGTDITFDWDKMLSLESNSSSYLQYTYARAMSIIKKYEELFGAKKQKSKAKQAKQAEEAGQVSLFEAIENTKQITHAPAELIDEKELLSARLAVKFPEYVIEAARQYKPNLLTNYLYDLAQNFNAFYHTVPVLQSENSLQRELRLELTKAVAKIISTGLNLLGIESPEKM
ncbi:arginine--tRNA ligase [Candidatus Peregrinibacteria bacterium]|nr:arginine--tRNA ligase [Candidatus Peregrinibacteria bacterium]